MLLMRGDVFWKIVQPIQENELTKINEGALNGQRNAIRASIRSIFCKVRYINCFR